MKNCGIPPGPSAGRRADFWLLAALVGLGMPVARAQSTVALSVETTKGGVVGDVKVVARHFDPEKKKLIEVIEIPEAAGSYTAEHLRKGLYEFIACDLGLKFEPDLLEHQVGENDRRRSFTLVLGDQPKTQRVPGLQPGTDVCLVHGPTGCEATRTIDGDGNIQYRGFSEHYHVEPRVCKKE
jgi:hypothetical protein